jgi:glycerophosphoryl diester phosphodiesterase
VLGLDAINPHFSAVTPAVWERASELGIACNVWTVNEPAEMTRLFDAEVASLITDAPDLALAVRAERGFATGQ